MLRVGLLGTGYIAAYHKKALGTIKQTHITAVCDVSLSRAEQFARSIPNCQAYANLNEMLEREQLDVIHILTPPGQHFEQAKIILENGINVFLEKPMCTSGSECNTLCDLAVKNNVTIGVNHNFLSFPAYQKLKKAIEQHEIGELDNITITWQSNLEVLKQGPYGGWMLQEPKNLWLETGSHLAAMLLDLTKDYEITTLNTGKRMILPNGKTIYRRWNVSGNADNAAFEMRLSYTPGFEDKSIELRGNAGYAKVDFLRDTFLLKRHTKYSQPFDLYTMNKKEARSLASQGYRFIRNYIFSKFKLVKFGDPYAASIAVSIQRFYAGLKQNEEKSVSRKFGCQVIEFCEKALAKGDLKANPELIKNKSKSTHDSEILVLGGAGFIGKALAEKLLKQGKKVRILARDPSKIEALRQLGDLDIMQGNILNDEDLQNALKGIKYVYHLATAHVKTWKEYQEYDVKATQKVGDACLAAGVQRLMYTGTIDSYYAGQSGETITEDTPLDPKIHRRNYYAQAKAAGERYLMKLNKEKQLPLIIIRPGIVIGMGSSPFHWGVGSWHYDTVCQYWGKGDNPLPFVLIEDVVQGLILAMDTSNIEGQSFNLIDKPCLSARDYVNTLEEVLQAKIETLPTPIWKFYAMECFKYGVKVLVGHRDRRFPSWRDWSSRTQRARFDCTKARDELGWQPAGQAEHILENGVRKPALYWWS